MIKDMNSLDMRWMKNRDYLEFSKYGVKLKDDTPQELRDSYENYLKQLAVVREREKETVATII